MARFPSTTEPATWTDLLLRIVRVEEYGDEETYDMTGYELNNLPGYRRFRMESDNEEINSLRIALLIEVCFIVCQLGDESPMPLVELLDEVESWQIQIRVEHERWRNDCSKNRPSILNPSVRLEQFAVELGRFADMAAGYLKEGKSPQEDLSEEDEKDVNGWVLYSVWAMPEWD
jgi:hypothetical protein